MLGKLNTFFTYLLFGIRIGANLNSSWKLSTALLRHKSNFFDSSKAYGVKIKINGNKVALNCRDMDIFILRDVFDDDSYMPKLLLNNPPERILDLGAHVGLATLRFVNSFPNALVYCYEPSPDNFKLLKKNVAGYNVKCFNEAIGDENAAITGEK